MLSETQDSHSYSTNPAYKGEGSVCLGDNIETILMLENRLNSSFRPLTFTKLRFWPTKKKTMKPSLKFRDCSSFDPQLYCHIVGNGIPLLVFILVLCL